MELLPFADVGYHIHFFGAQVKLFIEAFTEQAAFFPLLRASTPEQLEEGKENFAAGLRVILFTAPNNKHSWRELNRKCGCLIDTSRGFQRRPCAQRDWPAVKRSPWLCCAIARCVYSAILISKYAGRCLTSS